MKLHEIIERNKGKILSVTFIKKDGSIRRLNGIYGVRRFLKSGPRYYDPRIYICIWDIRKRDYRSVNKSTILEVIVNRQVYVAKEI